MAITDKLRFTRRQLKDFAHLMRATRQATGLTQLEVAQQAFGYAISHCKVSRVERSAMPKVDAVCIANMAQALGVPKHVLESIDSKFDARLRVAQQASKRGFWGYNATTV